MLLIILISIALIIFFAGNAVRVVKFLHMPTPLRWELYPIPKGPAANASGMAALTSRSLTGGRNPRGTGHVSEAIFMAKEMLSPAISLG